MKESLQHYFNQWETPWMQLYYRMVWAQLGYLENKKILDFGSGFGWNANHFAIENDVLAIEPNIEMVEARVRENDYQQTIGGLSELKKLPSASFDLIICHNVLEYAPGERAEILTEFDRLIKAGGVISIVKHNHAGVIMQKIIFENALNEAYDLLTGSSKENLMFGQIHYYDLSELTENLTLKSQKIYGLRTFWALQPNEWKTEPDWADKIFKVEWQVCQQPEYVAISFFNHLLLTK